jgi:hypothetical protein
MAQVTATLTLLRRSVLTAITEAGGTIRDDNVARYLAKLLKEPVPRISGVLPQLDALEWIVRDVRYGCTLEVTMTPEGYAALGLHRSDPAPDVFADLLARLIRIEAKLDTVLHRR